VIIFFHDDPVSSTCHQHSYLGTVGSKAPSSTKRSSSSQFDRAPGPPNRVPLRRVELNNHQIELLRAYGQTGLLNSLMRPCASLNRVAQLLSQGCMSTTTAAREEEETGEATLLTWAWTRWSSSDKSLWCDASSSDSTSLELSIPARSKRRVLCTLLVVYSKRSDLKLVTDP